MSAKHNFAFEKKILDQDLGMEVIPMAKLTQTKRFFKSDANNYIQFSIYDSKKLILSDNDIFMLDKINMKDNNHPEWSVELDRYLVKFVAAKIFYQVIDKRTYIGIMGLKFEILYHMMKFAENVLN
jgi:hypothetical protein